MDGAADDAFFWDGDGGFLDGLSDEVGVQQERHVQPVAPVVPLSVQYIPAFVRAALGFVHETQFKLLLPPELQDGGTEAELRAYRQTVQTLDTEFGATQRLLRSFSAPSFAVQVEIAKHAAQALKCLEHVCAALKQVVYPLLEEWRSHPWYRLSITLHNARFTFVMLSCMIDASCTVGRVLPDEDWAVCQHKFQQQVAHVFQCRIPADASWEATSEYKYCDNPIECTVIMDAVQHTAACRACVLCTYWRQEAIHWMRGERPAYTSIARSLQLSISMPPQDSLVSPTAAMMSPAAVITGAVDVPDGATSTADADDAQLGSGGQARRTRRRVTPATNMAGRALSTNARMRSSAVVLSSRSRITTSAPHGVSGLRAAATSSVLSSAKAFTAASSQTRIVGFLQP